MTSMVEAGTTFAGYRIESLIGRGGMGVVYRATDLSLDRPVALKLIAPEYAENERFRKRFLKEPKLAAALDHPNVVPIYEAREHDGQLYLAMRYVPGEDLRTRMARSCPPPPETTVRILAQVADALDAAHRRGLIHRDVKPANILVDEDGHAYLTDFGITKQVSSTSTATEQVVGTLDYMAPERIRGEKVDGRSDQYALACMLYECLVGRPPFRRESEAETLWAHMQGEVPSVPGDPEIDPVLAKGLAKEAKDRYATCTELMDAARAVLAPPAIPGVRSRRVRRAILRRRRPLLAAGAVLVAVAAGGAILSFGEEQPEAAVGAVGNGVAVIGGASGKVTALIESRKAPSNVAVGEGAVWVLNTDTRVVTRIDPETKRVTDTFEAPGTPTDIAAGEGALWIGLAGEADVNYTHSVARVDPKTHKVSHTAKLPDSTGEGALALFNWGRTDIVVGAGAVWAVNPDRTISRIDPATGRREAVIDVDVAALGADAREVWFLEGNRAVRIDPQTNSTGQRIAVGSPDPSAIAVGGGKVWVAASEEGLLWRIEPGPGPLTRSIDVGVGVDYVAYGAGSAWTANYVDGRVTRVDPETAKVTARARIGAAQALAADAGSAWVSTAGATAAGTLPEDVCGPLESGGRTPDVLIASDLPLQGGMGADSRALADAIRLVLSRHDFKAGRFTVGYRSCDDSTRQTGSGENRRCAANANSYASAHKLVAMIGPWSSYCAEVEIPILNRAKGGPLAMISSTNTSTGLTRPDSTPEGNRNEPDVYYPTGERNYMRVIGTEDLNGGALAILAKQRGQHRVYVLDDGSDFWKGLLSVPFRRAAKRLGVPVVGASSYDPDAKDFSDMADRIAEARPDAVVLGGDPFVSADRVVKSLRDRLGHRPTIMGGFFFSFVPDVLRRLGRDAHGIYFATSDLPRGVLPLGAEGRRFARELGAANRPFTLETGQATEVVLDAIARSDGTRASVLRELRATRVKDGILGSFGFDANGDITSTSVPVLRITGATPPGAGLPENFQGSVVDRVVKVPPSLVE
jgi:ABC-type branched-subunit amino acid transport system substrate-binding protein/DNA-binding beta-propeller fold protein YncE